MRKTLFSLFMLVMAFFAACRKDVPVEPQIWPQQTLPPETHTGENTFGCLIDGQIWIPYGIPNRPWYIISTQSNFTLHVWNDQTGEYFQLGFTCPRKDTSFLISNNDIHNKAQQFRFSKGGHTYVPVHGYVGQCTITRFDTVASIYSGTFSFNAIDTTNGKSVQISSARFDYR